MNETAGQKHKVYLAGPISGCNATQCHKWRQDLKNHFGDEFEFLDPSEWGKDWDFSREMIAIDQCDVVVANMWKESVGTAIGIMHARTEGKPVVLLDPNYLDSNILKGLIHPEEPVRSLKDAAARVRELVTPFPIESVLKRNGEIVPFEREKLVRSIRLACNAAKVDDTVLPQRIVAHTVEAFHSPAFGTTVTTDEIRETVYSSVRSLEDNPIHATEVRETARSIRHAWEKREQYKQVEDVFDDAADENEKLRAERDRLVRQVADLEEALRVSAALGAGSADVRVEADPTSVEEAVRFAKERFAEDLVILNSASDSSRACSFGKPDKAYRALRALADCAAERREAREQGRRLVGMEEWIKCQDGCSWLDYKPNESGTTMSLFGDERTFLYRGKMIPMPRHLAIGANSARGTLRIHFEEDEDTGQFVVGYVGDHLPTSRRHN
jgi:hypothetical protein